MRDLEEVIDLRTPDAAPASFQARIRSSALLTLEIAVNGEPPMRRILSHRSHTEYIDLFDDLALMFGLRRPLARTPPPPRGAQPELEPILTRPLSPDILYGYGDPCVVRVGPSDYRLLVTSNDAPNAFPILTSNDLHDWRLTGFVFPQGHTPTWAATGPDFADFWAPELHRIGDEWWVCFSARAHDGAMAIGLARAPTPDGPFIPDHAPIVTGDVIDAHIVADEAGAWLVWKKDDNGLWPGLLAGLLDGRPELAFALFDSDEDRRTAALAITLWPWTRTLAAMEQFSVLQSLIEAVAADLSGFAQRLSAQHHSLEDDEARGVIRRIAAALRTRIYAQRLSSDGRSLEGEPHVILQNDLPWEGHLIEGVWITPSAGRYYLLYAGNDFSTGYYGVGAAVADAPQGPYAKHEEIFLSSSERWWGPGHPSVTRRDDGGHQLFLHAFPAGAAGYKSFRALLTAPLVLRGGDISIGSEVGGDRVGANPSPG